MAGSSRKPDDAAIAAVVADVAARAWLGLPATWPGHLYHVTDVQNAAAILTEGRFFSRAEATRRELMAVDNAHPRIIAEAPAWLRSQVRLYFRPRTPTFAVNEGLHRAAARDSGEDAHCPVPVAFVLDAPAVLGRAGARFSRGSLARWTVEPAIGESAAFLAALPWHDIYNIEQIPSSSDCEDVDDLPEEARNECRRADRIRYHRQSEVIVPDALPLDSLIRVGVRSHAEWRTLQAVLADRGAPEDLMAKVGVDAQLFVRNQPHTQDARYNPHTGIIRVTFAGRMAHGIVMDAAIAWESPVGRVIEGAPVIGFKPNLSLLLEVPAALRGEAFRLTIWIEGAFAFSAWFSPASEQMIPPFR